MLSRTAEYALRAVVCLSRSQETALTSRHIAQEMNLPTEYLSKVLQSLGRARIVRAQRGPTGGFSLAVPASELSLYQVIDAVDPMRIIECCPIGLEEHKDSLCPLHRRLNFAAGALEGCLRETTLADLLLEEQNEESARNRTSADAGCVGDSTDVGRSSPTGPDQSGKPRSRYGDHGPGP